MAAKRVKVVRKADDGPPVAIVQRLRVALIHRGLGARARGQVCDARDACAGAQGSSSKRVGARWGVHV